MDVQLPDGRTLKGVPDGTTKAQLSEKLSANGIKFDAGEKEQAQPPVSAARTALEQGEQGATFGFSDEAMNMIGAGLAHMYTGEPYADILKEAAAGTKSRMEQEQKQRPGLSMASQLAGAVASPGMGGAKILGKVLPEAIGGSKLLARGVKGAIGGAAGGAASGAGTAEPGQRLKGAEKGAAVGAATGGVATAGMEALGRAAAPHFDKAVKLLRDEGVKLTPGQLSHGTVGMMKRAESALGSIPLVGSAVRSGIKNSMESFNTAVLNRALKPIGEKMPKSVEAGRDAIAHAEKTIGGKYDKLLPNLKFQADKQFIDDYGNFQRDTLSKLSPEMQKTFNSKFASITEHRLDKNLAMTGEDFKKVESELGYEARKYMSHTASPQERELGEALSQAQGVLRDSLERMNPKYTSQLKKINESWAIFKRAQDASIRRVKSNGVFSPTDLAQTIRKSSSKGAFARGDGMLQDLADAGMEVLPSTIPDSGTPERALWAAMLGGAAKFDPKMAIAGAALSAPYTKPGMAALGAWAGGSPTRDAIRQAISGASPALATAAGSEAGR